MTTEGRSLPPSGPTLRLELSSGLERELRIVDVISEGATGTLAVVEVLRPGGTWVRGLLQWVPGSPNASRRAGPSDGGDEATTRRSWADVGPRPQRRREEIVSPAFASLSAAALLDSPALAPMLEFGSLLDGGAYAISSLEHATTLRELLEQRGPTGPATACRFTAAAGRALSLLHRHGLAHRGVGPVHIIVRRHGGGPPMVELTRLDLEAYSLPHAVESPVAQTSRTTRHPGGAGARAELTTPDKAQDVDGLGRLLYMLLTGEATLPVVHGAEESSRSAAVDVAAVRRSIAAVAGGEQSGHAERVAEVVLGAVGASEGNVTGSLWSAEDIVDRLEALYPSPAPVLSPNGEGAFPSEGVAAVEGDAPLSHSTPAPFSQPATRSRILAEQLTVLMLGVALVLLGVVGYLHMNRPRNGAALGAGRTGTAAEQSSGSLGDSDQVRLPGVVVGTVPSPPESPATPTLPRQAPRPNAVLRSPGERPLVSVARAPQPTAPRTQPSPVDAPTAPPPASSSTAAASTTPARSAGTRPSSEGGLNRADLDVLVRGYAAAIESGKVDSMAVLYPSISSGERRSWERFFSLTSRRTARLNVREPRQRGDSVLAVVEGEIGYLNQSLGTTDRRPVSFLGVFRATSGSWRLIAVRSAGTGG